MILGKGLFSENYSPKKNFRADWTCFAFLLTPLLNGGELKFNYSLVYFSDPVKIERQG